MCSSGFTDFRAWTFDLWKCTLIHVGEKIFQKTEKTLCVNFKKCCQLCYCRRCDCKDCRWSKAMSTWIHFHFKIESWCKRPLSKECFTFIPFMSVCLKMHHSSRPSVPPVHLGRIVMKECRISLHNYHNTRSPTPAFDFKFNTASQARDVFFSFHKTVMG